MTQTTNSSGATLTAGFNAQIGNRERTPLCKVFLNWQRISPWNPDPVTGSGAGTNGDISQYVVSVDLNRTLTTDVPAGTRLAVGQQAATADIAVQGNSADNSQHAAWLWSPYNLSSPFTGAVGAPLHRVGAPVKVFFGFIGTSGPEYIQQFTGTIRDINPASADGTVTIECIDGWDGLHSKIRLPMVVANDQFGVTGSRWGMNSQWLQDYILRRNNIYASPPMRSTTVMSQTCHGSMYPERGDAVSCFMRISGSSPETFAMDKPTFQQGIWGLQPVGTVSSLGSLLPMGTVTPQVVDSTGANTGSPRLSFGSTAPSRGSPGVQFEGWLTAPAAWPGFGSTLGFWAISPATDYMPSPPNPSIIVSITNTGHLSVVVSPPTGGGTSLTDILTIPVGANHYFGVHVQFLSGTSGLVTFNVDGGTRTQSFTMASTWPSTVMGTVTFHPATVPVEAFMVSIDPLPNWVNATFTPTAVLDPGLNELGVVPYSDDATDSGQLLLDIAAAELATVGFDEKGIYRFRNRNAFQYGSAADWYGTDTYLTDVATSESVDSVVNHATSTATPYVVQPYSWVWATASKRPMHSHETIGITVVLDTPCFGIPVGQTDPNNPTTTGPFRWIPIGGIDTSHWNDGTVAPYNGYRASKDPYGQGYAVRNLIFSVQAFSKVVNIKITNPNDFPVYMVSPYQDASANPIPAASIGQPMLMIAGRPVVDATQVPAASEGTTAQQAAAKAIGSMAGSTADIADYFDQASMDAFQEQEYDFPQSIWCQDVASEQVKVQDVVKACSLPAPQFSNLPNIGDPRRQLGDHINVKSTPMVMDTGAVIVGIAATMNGDGYSGAFQLKPQAPPSGWILGDQSNGASHTSQSILGVSTILGGIV